MAGSLGRAGVGLVKVKGHQLSGLDSGARPPTGEMVAVPGLRGWLVGWLAVDPVCDKEVSALPGGFLRDSKAPGETREEALTGFLHPTARRWICNADKRDPLENEKLTLRNVDERSCSASPPRETYPALTL